MGHDNAVTKTVTLSDNYATFICHMTSDIFPTAYRNCSAGPIRVQKNDTQTAIIQIDTTMEAILQPSTLAKSKLKPQTEDANTGIERVSTVKASIWGVKGGVIGVFMATVIFTIIIVFMRRYYIRLMPQDQQIAVTSPSSTNQSPSADLANAEYQRDTDPEPYAELNQTNVSPLSPQQSTDHPYTAYQRQPDPEPYAALNKTNVSPSSGQQSADHPYTPYQKQQEQEPYAVLNQATTSVMSSDPDYLNMHDYEDTIPRSNELYETPLSEESTPNQTNASPSSNQQSGAHPYTAYQKQPDTEPYATLNKTNLSQSPDQKSADHPYTAYQRQPDPEPYAALNQATSVMSSDPDYLNMHDYEDSILSLN